MNLLRRRVLMLSGAAMVSMGAGVAAANPLGGSVAAGSSTISGQGTGSVTINQSSQNTVINWQTFNIGKGETTTFNQPNSNSVALNRVIGGQGPSFLDGTLTANGHVFIINGDGILFGANSSITTAGFLATTSDIRDADFMAGALTGKYNFNIPGTSSASIVNLGRITATSGGFAALVAPGLRNAGTITAKLGTVGLASGNAFTLDFYGDRLITLAVNDQIAAAVTDVATGETLKSLVGNSGKLKANGGRIELTAAAARVVVDSVINNTGVIEANSVGTKNGLIVLSAATGASKGTGAPVQTVALSGKISAAGKRAGTTGGTVVASGENIVLTGATINASGKAGGGKVLIGGDTGGGHPTAATLELAKLESFVIPTATTVSVDGATVINASATGQGNGGKVVLWSDQQTTFAGTILARGGAAGGDGGFVETSSHSLDFKGGRVDTLALKGATGTWLLDPTGLMIDAEDASTLSHVLATTSVILQTNASGPPSGPSGTFDDTANNSDISVNAQISWSSNSTLTLNAHDNINVNAAITAANGGLTLSAGKAINPAAAVNVATFTLKSGAWVQSSASLPSFSARDFRLAGGSFVRVLGGNGSSGSPYQIGDIYGLQGIGSSSTLLAANYVLAKNVDASGTANWNSGAGFAPIGNNSTQFIGGFNGQGHTITGLGINRPTSNDTGLFGSVGKAGAIQNVGLIGGSVTGGTNVGELVGSNYGRVQDAYSTGPVSGSGAVGGLVGDNLGSVTQTYATGSASGGSNVGGLVGLNSGSVAQSYATGAAIGSSNVGGLIGSNQASATVTQSYSVGAATGESRVGGLIGFNSGNVSFSYWDATNTNAGLGGSGGGAFAATGLTTAQMQDPTAFTTNFAGFNFQTTWSPPSAGYFPELYALTPVVWLEANNVTRTYGAANPALTLAGTFGGPSAYLFGPAGDMLSAPSLTTAAKTVSPVGIYAIGASAPTATSLDGISYRVVSTGALAVTPAPLTVTANNAGKTYDGLAFSGGNGVSYSGFVNGETAAVLAGNIAYGGNSQGAVNAGGYQITASGQSAQNYAISYQPGTLMVNQAALTVTANNAGKTYDGLAFSGGNGVSYSGFVNGETATVLAGTIGYAGSAQGAVNAGGYQITASGQSAQNYAISYQPGTLTVNQAALTVTANNAGKTYDGLAFSGGNGVSYSGFVNGETATVLAGTIAYAGNAQGAVNAGGYQITASGQSAQNYAISYQPGTLTVNQAALTVTANNAGKTYDGLAFSGGNGVSYSGFVNGETATVLAGTIAYAGNAQGAVNAGGYQITASGQSAQNYAISYQPGTLTVNQAALTVTANNAGKTYDGLAFSGGNGVSYSGFVNGETAAVLTGNIAYGGNSQGAVNAGGYQITASGQSAQNYAISYQPGTLTVGQAALTVTANNAGKTYDGLAFSGGNGVSYSGFVNGETAAVLAGTIAYGGNAQGAVNAGGYQITASGQSAQNYAISYQPGTLTVNQVALTVTANNAGKTYDGLAFSGGNGVSYSGFVNGETATVLTGNIAYGGNSQGAVNAGGYQITASGQSAQNYAISYQPGTLTVNQAALTVTANNAGKTYDGLAFSGGNGVSYSGFVNGETAAVLAGTIAYAGNAQGAVNAGGYQITASGQSAQNYAISYQPGTLTVNQAALTVTANNAGKTYDGLAFSGGNGVSYSGFVNGETATVLAGTIAYAGNAQGAVNAGGYQITASGQSAQNYAISYQPGTLTVNQAALTVTANNAGKTYDGLAFSGGNGVSYSGFVNGETATVLTGNIAYGGSAQGAVNAGGYQITASGQSAQNYAISYQPGTLTVNQAALTVTANNAGKTYDGLAFSGGNGVSYSGFVNGETATVLAGTIAYAGNAQGAVNAGGYQITASGQSAQNYAISYQPGTLTVNQAALTVTANNAGKTYDGLAFSGGNGVSYSGFVNGETATVLAGTIAYAGNAQGAVNAGGYQITASGQSAQNYAISYQPGTLTVNPAPVTVTALGGSSTYGGSPSDPGFTATGLQNGQGVGALTGLGNSFGITNLTNAGGYVLNVAGTLTNPNYIVTVTNPGTWVVNPATLTYVANPAIAPSGASIPTLGGVVVGFVNGDSLSAVAIGSPSFVTPAPGNAPGGIYPIDGQGLTVISSNYVLVQAPTNATALTINPGGNIGNTPTTEAQVLQNLIQNISLTPPQGDVVNIQPLTQPPPGRPGSGPPSAPGGLPPQFGARFFVPPELGAAHKDNEVVLQIPNNIPAAQLQAMMRRLGLSILGSQSLGLLGVTSYWVHIDNGASIASVIQALAGYQIVAGAQANYTYVLTQGQSLAQGQEPDLASLSQGEGDAAQYTISKLGLIDVHRQLKGGNISVAVIDSQIDVKHPDLDGVVAEQFDAVGAADMPHSHGTGMAGAIFAHRKLMGVAPSARLYAIHAFSSGATSAESTTFNILKGLEWASAKGVRVINMSFAGPRDPSMERALKAAHDKGIVLIAAAGNAGPKSPPLYPGADPNVIAVTATDVNDKLFTGANRGRYIAVAAPGVDILVPAPDNTYQLTTGTSVASAEVSGLVALLLERNPNLGPEEVRKILTSSARRLSAKDRDDDFGSGLVDPSKAIQTAGDLTSVEMTGTVPPQPPALRPFTPARPAILSQPGGSGARPMPTR